VNADEIARRLGDDSIVLVDVRSREEYTGEAGYPCDPKQGHIPGAVHLDWELLYGDGGRALGREALVALLAERGVDPDAELVCYCHSGSRSAMASSALRLAGFVADNYSGSWHEWSRRD
jgi:thiosulfate/3-mercaptopyruvate sulfurtransferase